MENYKYKVRVSCMTFNHAPYIEDAMNGFCMQETTFPFVCTIVDDASTDGEPEVIKNYLKTNFDLDDESVACDEETEDYHLTFAQHKTNRNCFFAVLFLKYNHYSIKKEKKPYLEKWSNTKYMATCEGDDYWIDNEKIQKQVEVMDENDEIGLCYCRYKSNDKEYGSAYKGIEQLITRNRIATLTTMVRKHLYDKYYTQVAPASHGWKMGDYPCWLWMELNSEVVFLNRIVAVYRVLSESASHSKDIGKRIEFIESSRNIRLYYARKYDLDDRIIEKIEDSYLREKASVYQRKNKAIFRKCISSLRKKTINDRLRYLYSYFK